MWVELGTLEETREFDLMEGLHQRDLVDRAPFLSERCEVMYNQESRDDYGLDIIINKTSVDNRESQIEELLASGIEAQVIPCVRDVWSHVRHFGDISEFGVAGIKRLRVVRLGVATQAYGSCMSPSCLCMLKSWDQDERHESWSEVQYRVELVPKLAEALLESDGPSLFREAQEERSPSAVLGRLTQQYVVGWRGEKEGWLDKDSVERLRSPIVAMIFPIPGCPSYKPRTLRGTLKLAFRLVGLSLLAKRSQGKAPPPPDTHEFRRLAAIRARDGQESSSEDDEEDEEPHKSGTKRKRSGYVVGVEVHEPIYWCDLIGTHLVYSPHSMMTRSTQLTWKDDHGASLNFGVETEVAMGMMGIDEPPLPLPGEGNNSSKPEGNGKDGGSLNPNGPTWRVGRLRMNKDSSYMTVTVRSDAAGSDKSLLTRLTVPPSHDPLSRWS